MPGWAEDVSFEVRAGEILGFAGLVGAGRTELFEGLLGLRPHAARRMELRGQAGAHPQPARRRADHGLTYLSEDRKGKGLHVAIRPAREPHADVRSMRYARPLLRPALRDAGRWQAR